MGKRASDLQNADTGRMRVEFLVDKWVFYIYSNIYIYCISLICIITFKEHGYDILMKHKLMSHALVTLKVVHDGSALYGIFLNA